MQGKTVVITGASGGIGLETARVIAARGAKIVMVVRSRERGEAAIAEVVKTTPAAQVELVLADLYSMAEVRRAASELGSRFARIDVLINNAGLIHNNRELTVDGFEKTFALNVLAPFVLTYELRELLAASAPARVVTLASSAHKFYNHTFDDLATREKSWPSASRVYGSSKLCNIWFAREAAQRFAGKGVTSNSLHPGVVRTSFGATGSLPFRIAMAVGRPFMISVERGAETSIHLATSPDVAGVTGEYFEKCKVATPSADARNDDSARALWALCEQTGGVRWA